MKVDEIGVQHLDWILHTHHHRDLCLGDAAAAFDGVNIAVPVGEAGLFADAEAHWSQWDYMPVGDGASSLVDSLGEILSRQPTMLLPTRGEPMTEPGQAIEPLREKLRRYVHHIKPNHAGRKRGDLHQVAENIWRNQQFLDGGTLKGFTKLRSLLPDVILPAHTDPINPVTPEYFNLAFG